MEKRIKGSFLEENGKKYNDVSNFRSQNEKFDYIKALNDTAINAANYQDQNLNRKLNKNLSFYELKDTQAQAMPNQSKDSKLFENKIADYQRFYSQHFAPSNNKNLGKSNQGQPKTGAMTPQNQPSAGSSGTEPKKYSENINNAIYNMNILNSNMSNNGESILNTTGCNTRAHCNGMGLAGNNSKGSLIDKICMNTDSSMENLKSRSSLSRQRRSSNDLYSNTSSKGDRMGGMAGVNPGNGSNLLGGRPSAKNLRNNGQKDANHELTLNLNLNNRTEPLVEDSVLLERISNISTLFQAQKQIADPQTMGFQSEVILYGNQYPANAIREFQKPTTKSLAKSDQSQKGINLYKVGVNNFADKENYYEEMNRINEINSYNNKMASRSSGGNVAFGSANMNMSNYGGNLNFSYTQQSLSMGKSESNLVANENTSLQAMMEKVARPEINPNLEKMERVQSNIDKLIRSAKQVQQKAGIYGNPNFPNLGSSNLLPLQQKHSNPILQDPTHTHNHNHNTQNLKPKSQHRLLQASQTTTNLGTLNCPDQPPKRNPKKKIPAELFPSNPTIPHQSPFHDLFSTQYMTQNTNSRQKHGNQNLDRSKNSKNSKNDSSRIREDSQCKLNRQNLEFDECNSIGELPIKKSNYARKMVESESVKVVKGFAANTDQGLVRKYNEDRVSIILNFAKPKSYNKEKWPVSSFFGVFDGHGGHSCAEFLKENLHKFVIKDPEFPENPKQALINGFREAEEVFTKTALSGEEVEKSGSCCLVILIVDKTCYIANVGDSRAIASFDCGSIIQAVTRDHKPSLPSEKQRIINAGGKLYQSQITNAKG